MQKGLAATYGIGEWYGKSFVRLSAAVRREFGELQTRGKAAVPTCPFRNGPDGPLPCSKKGGVCSIRKYLRQGDSDRAIAASGHDGALCTTCPQRFAEGGLIYRWIGEELLGVRNPIVLGEIGFLMGTGDEGDDGGQGREDVGRIDNVLVSPATDPLSWCALETQAVYFSGSAMGGEFEAVRKYMGKGVPFPVARRHPDYRSSGPKRLMPQLQIKVPTLRRWGKKMAVIVDAGFFRAMGEMARVDEVSNGDIVWFVVGYDEAKGEARLARRDMLVTTLESSVDGLTAGRPVSLPTFEARIREKVSAAGSATR